MIKIVIIQCDTIEELDAACDKINLDDKDAVIKEIKIPLKIKNTNFGEIMVNEYGEVDGQTLEGLLLKKGYKVRSLKAKMKRCKQLFIGYELRGKSYKYLLTDIEAVPVRKSKSLLVKSVRKDD